MAVRGGASGPGIFRFGGSKAIEDSHGVVLWINVFGGSDSV